MYFYSGADIMADVVDTEADSGLQPDLDENGDHDLEGVEGSNYDSCDGAVPVKQ